MLKLDYPVVNTKYNNSLRDIFAKKGIYKEIEAIHKECTFPMRPHVMRRFERLDSKILEAQFEAEKKCTHLYTGGVEWAPQVKQAYNLVCFWLKMVDQLNNKVIHYRRYEQLCKQYSLVYPWDIHEATQEL